MKKKLTKTERKERQARLGQLRAWVESNQYEYGAVGQSYTEAAERATRVLCFPVSARQVSRYADPAIWTGRKANMGDFLKPYTAEEWQVLRKAVRCINDDSARAVVNNVESGIVGPKSLAIELAKRGEYHPLENIREVMNIAKKY